MGKFIYQQLANSSDLAPRFGNRIYPVHTNRKRSELEFPNAVYTVSGLIPDYKKGGGAHSKDDTYEVEFDVYGDSYLSLIEDCYLLRLEMEKMRLSDSKHSIVKVELADYYEGAEITTDNALMYVIGIVFSVRVKCK
ncbi:hypothetical protein [Marinifilum flexuosum]|uniref:hypothetical protein n=1 Tax=Marinifilum flexuosum TaxID=1117708 RepID=UPI0024941CF6|nr:hypothetical protein [Marinifilum flexuosum]